MCDDTRDMIAIQFCDSFVVDGYEGCGVSLARSRVEEVSFTRHKSFLVSSNMRKVLARARLCVSKECRAVIMSGSRMTRHEKSSNPHLGAEIVWGKKAKQIHVSIVVTYFFFNFKFDYNLCHQARRRCVWPENVNELRRRRRPIHTFIFYLFPWMMEIRAIKRRQRDYKIEKKISSTLHHPTASSSSFPHSRSQFK